MNVSLANEKSLRDSASNEPLMIMISLEKLIRSPVGITRWA